MDQGEKKEVPDQEDKIKLGILISEKDKEHRKKNKMHPQGDKQKNDYHKIEIQDGDRKQTIYAAEDPNHDEAHKEIQEKLNDKSHQIHEKGKNLLKDQLTAHSPADSQLPKKSGLIQKKSPHLLQGWQPRFVEIENKVLKYYVPGEQKKPFGILNFDITSFKYEEVRDKQGVLTEFIVRPVEGQKVFPFKAESPDGTNEWAQVVKKHIDASIGAQSNLNGLCKHHRFWRVRKIRFAKIFFYQTERITEKQFRETANTGDIMLFRGTSGNCQVQRLFTQSEFDHVALILRFSQGEIYLFEATGTYGVGLCSWQSMIENEWYTLYDKLVYRKLEVQRDKEFLDKVQKFVNENIGKKYSCSPQKLIKQKSTVAELHKDNNNSNKNKKEEEKTFFCSELVAAVYKNLGLLPSEKAASQYWPGTFSNEKKDLELLKGAKLNPDQLIDFTLVKQ